MGLTTLPCTAVIPVVPVATVVASPEATLIVATVLFDDAQITWFVMSCVELSL